MNTFMMIPLLAAASVLSPLTADDSATIRVSAQMAQKLRDAGFVLAFSAGPAQPAASQRTATQPAATQPAVIRDPKLMVEAETRLLYLANASVFEGVDNHPALVACFRTADHPDLFVTSATVAGKEVKAAVSELQTDFSIVFREGRRQDAQTALAEFHSWITRLLNPAWLVQGGDKASEVADDGDYFVVRKVLFDERGNRRDPWSKSESLRMALDKDGRWLILTVENLPDRVSDMPQSRKISSGRWFDRPPDPPGTVKKK